MPPHSWLIVELRRFERLLAIMVTGGAITAELIDPASKKFLKKFRKFSDSLKIFRKSIFSIGSHDRNQFFFSDFSIFCITVTALLINHYINDNLFLSSIYIL